MSIQRYTPVEQSPYSEPSFSVREFRCDFMLDNPAPPMRWLIKDLIPLGKAGLIVAPGGTGKSYFVMQLGVSVATGIRLCNCWEVAEKGGVLLLMGEDDRDELHRRLRRIIEHHDSSGMAELDTRLRDNLHMKSMVGHVNLITGASGSAISRTKYLEWLVKVAREIPDLKLIVLDPVSRFRGGEENNAADNTRFVEALEYIQEQTGATVLAPHHANKASMKTGGGEQQAARGSSALTDGVRWQMNMATMSEQEANTYTAAEERSCFVKVTVPKNNYGPPVGEIWLQRHHGILEVVELTSSREADEAALLRKVIEKIRAEGTKGKEYSKSAFERGFGGTNGPFKCGKKKLRDVIDEGLKQGKLVMRAPNKSMRNVKEVLAIPESPAEP